jgi:hypothetical protein
MEEADGGGAAAADSAELAEMQLEYNKQAREP